MSLDLDSTEINRNEEPPLVGKETKDFLFLVCLVSIWGGGAAPRSWGLMLPIGGTRFTGSQQGCISKTLVVEVFRFPIPFSALNMEQILWTGHLHMGPITLIFSNNLDSTTFIWFRGPYLICVQCPAILLNEICLLNYSASFSHFRFISNIFATLAVAGITRPYNICYCCLFQQVMLKVAPTVANFTLQDPHSKIVIVIIYCPHEIDVIRVSGAASKFGCCVPYWWLVKALKSGVFKISHWTSSLSHKFSPWHFFIRRVIEIHIYRQKFNVLGWFVSCLSSQPKAIMVALLHWVLIVGIFTCTWFLWLKAPDIAHCRVSSK